ncbi:VanZ family protein [Pontimicrobium aquaticum]|uniref:VanZ like family protein n=1 Tax=Pontimicrobium aquaticum TaxID=2565367 RepID=A0A4U0ENC3_9FLAO|nr:VanZ family protein [Pontimicrobium aquaticum]TJY32534.1 hypothetical protein E5167_14315 [Pontimicrobium aquaticum]
MLNKQTTYLFLALAFTLALTVISLVSNDGLPYFGTNYEDKIYHLLAYAVLCFLWYKAFVSLNSAYPITFALMLCVIYGIIIEVLQGQLTVTRDASIMDIVANSLGAAIVSLILTLRKKTIVKNL